MTDRLATGFVELRIVVLASQRNDVTSIVSWRAQARGSLPKAKPPEQVVVAKKVGLTCVRKRRQQSKMSWLYVGYMCAKRSSAFDGPAGPTTVASRLLHDVRSQLVHCRNVDQSYVLFVESKELSKDAR